MIKRYLITVQPVQITEPAVAVKLKGLLKKPKLKY